MLYENAVLLEISRVITGKKTHINPPSAFSHFWQSYQKIFFFEKKWKTPKTALSNIKHM